MTSYFVFFLDLMPKSHIELCDFSARRHGGGLWGRTGRSDGPDDHGGPAEALRALVRKHSFRWAPGLSWCTSIFWRN
ncbi:MAG: hypothetical protein Ct9H300mP16_06290 [Pseudomonadota bacterium]|nr:MAG: hypothetical protein Ct9H300mP16_06290 [Pseudomonadota bacterium]